MITNFSAWQWLLMIVIFVLGASFGIAHENELLFFLSPFIALGSGILANILTNRKRSTRDSDISSGLVGASVAAGIVILDLSTKSLVLHLSDNFTDNALIADKFFDIGVFWHSGLLADVGPTAALIIQCAANIVWVFLLVKSQNRASAVGAALLLGGGIGNLVTWLAFSRVLNIFRFDIGQSNPFGFNIGDVATLLGVIILLGSWSSSVLHRQ